MTCDICGSNASVVRCEKCGKNFCASCSGAAVGVEESPYCKKCTLKVYRVRCKKCGKRFQSQEELEKHFLKHPLHKTQFD
ncbi:MAG: hypothetical protein ACTSRG_04240 [Candidatus Helarchaeota archaeon]